jgi:hypothetical protein
VMRYLVKSELLIISSVLRHSISQQCSSMLLRSQFKTFIDNQVWK